MNGERFAGIRLQLAGRLNEAWGELTGDPLRVAAARRDRTIGRAQQESGAAHETADRELRDFQHHNRNWYF